MFGFRAEPAAIAELVRLVFIALMGFGVIHWTDAQMASVLAVLSVVLTFFVRQNVTSQATLAKAGTSQEQVERVADSPTQTLTVSHVGGA